MGEMIQFRLGGPAPLAFVTMLAIFGASLWVFATLVRRETRHRRLTALNQWARAHDLRLGSAEDPNASAALGPLAALNPTILKLIKGGRTAIAQIEIAGGGIGASAAAPRVWNVLLREWQSSWPATALRPTAHAMSVVDLFSLSSFPSLMPTQRFVVFGTEARAARAMANSHAPALLPADVGVLAKDRFLILDFSNRPFDEIEFDRLLDLAGQLEVRLTSALAESK